MTMLRCYWCLEEKNVLTCSNCNKMTCISCYNGKAEEKCIVCKVVDFNNKDQHGYIEFRHSINNIEQLLYNTLNADKSQILSFENFSIDQAPLYFDLIRDNTFNFLTDIRRLEEIIEPLLKANDVEYLENVLKPFIGLIIKQFMIIRIGKMNKIEFNIENVKEENLSETVKNSCLIADVETVTSKAENFSNEDDENVWNSFLKRCNTTMNNDINVKDNISSKSEPVPVEIDKSDLDYFVVNEDDDDNDSEVNTVTLSHSSSTSHKSVNSQKRKRRRKAGGNWSNTNKRNSRAMKVESEAPRANQFLISETVPSTSVVDNSISMSSGCLEGDSIDYDKNKHLVRPINFQGKRTYITRDPMEIESSIREPPKSWSWERTPPTIQLLRSKKSTQKRKNSYPLEFNINRSDSIPDFKRMILPYGVHPQNITAIINGRKTSDASTIPLAALSSKCSDVKIPKIERNV